QGSRGHRRADRRAQTAAGSGLRAPCEGVRGLGVVCRAAPRRRARLQGDRRGRDARVRAGRCRRARALRARRRRARPGPASAPERADARGCVCKSSRRRMSPIHDQGYRRYGGQRTPPGHAWSVIAKAGIRTLISKRAFVALLLLAWMPFIVRAVQIYAATSLPQAAFLAPDAQMFRQFLQQQEVFLFFITVYAGAGLIATDRR